MLTFVAEVNRNTGIQDANIVRLFKGKISKN